MIPWIVPIPTKQFLDDETIRNISIAASLLNITLQNATDRLEAIVDKI
jgi:hypothetical protein